MDSIINSQRVFPLFCVFSGQNVIPFSSCVYFFVGDFIDERTITITRRDIACCVLTYIKLFICLQLVCPIELQFSGHHS